MRVAFAPLPPPTPNDRCRCSLRGLDAFPNVQTLVLDSNGLLTLPMDCPWCPAMETLWLCNNEVENLDGLLYQVWACIHTHVVRNGVVTKEPEGRADCSGM